MANAPNVEIVTKNPDIVGECPEWNAEQGELLWTDNRSQRVYGYSQATGAVRTIVEGVATYAFTQQRDGTLLLFLADTRVAIARDGTIEDIVDGLPGEEGARFNDVLVDSAGRVVCGVVSTGADGTGSLYSLALTSTPRATKLHGGMRMPNGMAFSPDEQVLYVADTRAGQIVAFSQVLPLRYDRSSNSSQAKARQTGSRSMRRGAFGSRRRVAGPFPAMNRTGCSSSGWTYRRKNPRAWVSGA
jgi:sugar lactone lactonase YvrE